ncbi:cytochrome P450 [Bradyrhizobium sp.]|uniref:cytochrome P450 n=1 Tax=Bradyrhizobium sp. TaxID=376 RepID=UPI0025C649D5|nr:cytochrome P450 [Bradyrhizobium sp.]
MRVLARNPLECWSQDFFSEKIARVGLPIGQAFVVNDPAAIRHVLIDNASNYRKDPIQRRVLSAGLADGLLSAEGERWDIQRRTLAPLFSLRNVRSLTANMLQAVDQLSRRWLALPPGSVVDVVAEMTLLTLNVLALTIFSDGLQGDLDEFRGSMNDYFRAAGRIGLLDLVGAPDFVPRPGGRKLKATLGYFQGVIDALIETRQSECRKNPSDQRCDLLSLLLGALDPATGRAMSPAEVRSNILTFLSAGHETTANTLSWSLYLLSQSDAWRAAVEAEAGEKLAGPPDTLFDRLTVTRAVVEEALRLYPPISALSRLAQGPDRLGCHDIKARALIVISPYVLHRHVSLWDQPDLFDPSRFLPESRRTIERFAYLPFGAGPRTCIGSTFALQEATIALATLVDRFSIALAAGAKVWPVMSVTLRPGAGLPMRITPKSNVEDVGRDCLPGVTGEPLPAALPRRISGRGTSRS